MSLERERTVTSAFVSLADRLVGPFDVVELLKDLTDRCAQLLNVDSSGLVLADRVGVLHVVAASSEETRSLELFQLQREQGPCLDCYRTGAPVRVADLEGQAHRWPHFVAAALRLGFVSVHALPMRLHDQVLGALGLFRTTVGPLDDDDLELGQALAHVASVALVTGSAAADQERLNQQLQAALDSRVFIEQAKGAVAQYAGGSMNEAFVLLRAYARSHNLQLTDVAQRVASRTLAIERIASPPRVPRPPERT
jgi:transcriptional regulator with GAF, ATPase, and Fis domain